MSAGKIYNLTYKDVNFDFSWDKSLSIMIKMVLLLFFELTKFKIWPAEILPGEIPILFFMG